MACTSFTLNQQAMPSEPKDNSEKEEEVCSDLNGVRQDITLRLLAHQAFRSTCEQLNSRFRLAQKSSERDVQSAIKVLSGLTVNNNGKHSNKYNISSTISNGVMKKTGKSGVSCKNKKRLIETRVTVEKDEKNEREEEEQQQQQERQEQAATGSKKSKNKKKVIGNKNNQEEEQEQEQEEPTSSKTSKKTKAVTMLTKSKKEKKRKGTDTMNGKDMSKVTVSQGAETTNGNSESDLKADADTERALVQLLVKLRGLRARVDSEAAKQHALVSQLREQCEVAKDLAQHADFKKQTIADSLVVDFLLRQNLNKAAQLCVAGHDLSENNLQDACAGGIEMVREAGGTNANLIYERRADVLDGDGDQGEQQQQQKQQKQRQKHTKKKGGGGEVEVEEEEEENMKELSAIAKRTKLKKSQLKKSHRNLSKSTSAEIKEQQEQRVIAPSTRVYETRGSISDSILRGDLSHALRWCLTNKTKLKRLKSDLEFGIREQEFLALIRSDNVLEAIEYAQNNLTPMLTVHPNVDLSTVKATMGSLAVKHTKRRKIDQYCALYGGASHKSKPPGLRSTMNKKKNDSNNNDNNNTTSVTQEPEHQPVIFKGLSSLAQRFETESLLVYGLAPHSPLELLFLCGLSALHRGGPSNSQSTKSKGQNPTDVVYAAFLPHASMQNAPDNVIRADVSLDRISSERNVTNVSDTARPFDASLAHLSTGFEEAASGEEDGDIEMQIPRLPDRRPSEFRDAHIASFQILSAKDAEGIPKITELTEANTRIGGLSQICPCCSPILEPLRAIVPRAHVSHSMFVCPVLGLVTNESNVPLVLPNGHVVCEKAREQLIVPHTDPIRLKCPVTSAEFLASLVRRAFLV